MKDELIALQPVLIQTSKEVEETLVVVNKEAAEAAAKAEVVAGEEAIANEAAAKAGQGDQGRLRVRARRGHPDARERDRRA